MKKSHLIFIGISLLIVMTGRAQIIECTPDPACEENIPGNGTVCPDELSPIYVNQYYDKTITVIPPATFEGFSIISHMRIDDVHNLPPGVEWGKSEEIFAVTNPVTRYCVKLYGTPEVVGEYQLVLEITPFIWGTPSPFGPVEDDTSFLLIVLPQGDYPAALFTSDVVEITTYSEVMFTDLSTNNPTQWQWGFEGGTPSESTQQNPVVYWTEEGVYDVTLTVANAAGENSITVEDYITVYDDQNIINQLYEKVNVYPNPAITKITVEADDLIFVEVLDLQGRRLLLDNNNTNNKTEIDISSFDAGIYFLIINTGNGIFTRNIIIH